MIQKCHKRHIILTHVSEALNAIKWIRNDESLSTIILNMASRSQHKMPFRKPENARDTPLIPKL